MKIDITGIVIVCGNYGSGKTETAVNLALQRKKDGIKVKIADLDLVNPYFRTRETRHLLEDQNIGVVLPPNQYHNADLPILAPTIAGMIKSPTELTILDTGGDDAGVRVLGALENHLKGRHAHMLQVINPFRPVTRDVAGCIRIMHEIEASSKMKVTCLASNAHLMDETRPEHIYQGHELLKKVSETKGLPIKFVTARSDLINQLDVDKIGCPILEIVRHLTPPWN